jgi:hypothetical protein
MLTIREAAAELLLKGEFPRLVTGSLYLQGDLLREWKIKPFENPIREATGPTPGRNL